MFTSKLDCSPYMFGSCKGAFFRENGAQNTKGAFHSTKIPIWNFGNIQAQWIGTFWLHRPDPSHRAFRYYSCKQDTKEQYWGQQFCQMERDISVLPAEMTWPVKVDNLQSWSGIFWLDQTEMVRSIWYTNPEFWVERKAPVDFRFISALLHASWAVNSHER